MTNRIKTSAVALFATMTLVGCDSLLDVNNPNNLVEESIRQEAAASAVVNGSLSLTARAVASMWEPYLVATDEFYWIGSRDAWLSLDQGFLSDVNNEFTDAAFPNLAQARWMADEAVEILEEHVAEKPASASFKRDLARANFFSAIVYLTIGEVQQDFAFSNKTEDGAPVGPSNMSTVLDGAISRLDKAVSLFGELGDADQVLNARAVRARAKHSRAVWSKIKPSPNLSAPYVDAGADDAGFVVANAAADWTYSFAYSAGTIGNGFAQNVNDRKENQIDKSLAVIDAANDVAGVAYMDPIDNVIDPVVTAKIRRWKSGEVTDKGSRYSPLDLVSTRMMHLILAESELAKGSNAGFTTHINHVRSMDNLTPYGTQMSAKDMLNHERRVNTLFMGQRLADMYRFGIKDAKWEPNGDAISAPGTLLPITIIEIRANCNLNGLGCGG